MSITKEYLDEKFNRIDQRFDKQTEELKAYADQQTEKLAGMVAEGFEEIKAQLDVRERVQKIQTMVERKFAKLEEALHIKL